MQRKAVIRTLFTGSLACPVVSKTCLVPQRLKPGRASTSRGVDELYCYYNSIYTLCYKTQFYCHATTKIHVNTFKGHFVKKPCNLNVSFRL